eukprot:6175385-Pleurochrysis_carterae.AAC.2
MAQRKDCQRAGPRAETSITGAALGERLCRHTFGSEGRVSAAVKMCCPCVSGVRACVSGVCRAPLLRIVRDDRGDSAGGDAQISRAGRSDAHDARGAGEQELGGVDEAEAEQPCAARLQPPAVDAQHAHRLLHAQRVQHQLRARSNRRRQLRRRARKNQTNRVSRTRLVRPGARAKCPARKGALCAEAQSAHRCAAVHQTRSIRRACRDRGDACNEQQRGGGGVCDSSSDAEVLAAVRARNHAAACKRPRTVCAASLFCAVHCLRSYPTVRKRQFACQSRFSPHIASTPASILPDACQVRAIAACSLRANGLRVLYKLYAVFIPHRAASGCLGANLSLCAMRKGRELRGKKGGSGVAKRLGAAW